MPKKNNEAHDCHEHGQEENEHTLTLEEFKKIMMDRATLLATRFKEHVLSQRPNINQVAFAGFTELDEQAVEVGLADAVVLDINQAIAAMKV